jgi:cbb3-type cytochrome oxidase maturation protein
LLIALFFLGSFIWATKAGQFDDDYTPSVRILFDDEIIEEEKQTKQQSNNGDSEV